MPSNEKFRPMLAGKAKVVDIRFPVLASPKIDGIRCLMRNRTAQTRSLKPIPNKHTRDLLEKLAPAGCDGELIVGHSMAGDFNETQSAIMSKEGEPKVMYCVFDSILTPEIPYGKRWASFLRSHFSREIKEISGEGFLSVVPVPQKVINSQLELEAYYANVLNRGFEGVMVRSAKGTYKYGRSTVAEGGLLKLKPFEDAEATVIDVHELMINCNPTELDNLGLSKRSSKSAHKRPGNTMGSLTVKAINGNFAGVEFDLGSGFTQSLRDHIWQRKEHYIGKTLKFKYQDIGSVDRPRIPVFLYFVEV